MTEHPTPEQTRYISQLLMRLRIPTNVWMEALYRGYGVQMVGRLSQVEACEVVSVLRRVALGYWAMPADRCDLFRAGLERAA